MTTLIEFLIITATCVAGYYIATAPSRKGK
jgi:hypothetical protein